MSNQPTIVLAHAAWADATSWSKVIQILQAQGFPVVSAQLPLTSLYDDAAALRRVLARLDGPVVLAGHSYGGGVITAAATGQANVKALVYIAAMGPDEGERIAELLHRHPRHEKAPALSPDAGGWIWMPAADYARAVAPDSTPAEIALMVAAQKPLHVDCISQPMTAPAWLEKPSWFLVAERDYSIVPSIQRVMAERMKANIVSLDVDHAPIVSAPEAVVAILTQAVDSL